MKATELSYRNRTPRNLKNFQRKSKQISRGSLDEPLRASTTLDVVVFEQNIGFMYPVKMLIPDEEALHIRQELPRPLCVAQQQGARVGTCAPPHSLSLSLGALRTAPWDRWVPHQHAARRHAGCRDGK